MNKGLFSAPNLFTMLRIVLVPVLVIAFYFPLNGGHSIAAAIFVLAAISDWLDGYLARRMQLSSRFGAFLDPVADKILVAIALVLLVSDPNLYYITIPSTIIIGREIIVSGLREWMAEIGKRASVAVSFVGKAKTACQMLSIVLLLYCHAGVDLWLQRAGVILLYAAAVLTLWSMVMYLKAAWKDLLASAE